MLRRLVSVLFLATLLLALTPVVVYAAPVTQGGTEPEKETTPIEDVISTLGLYAAMIAALAVGTEVVIDVIRPVFGLERKTTATEAFAKLREWLPGTVKDLGLPEDAVERLNKTMEDLEKVTKNLAHKAEEAKEIVEDRLSEILADLARQSVVEVL